MARYISKWDISQGDFKNTKNNWMILKWHTINILKLILKYCVNVFGFISLVF